MTEATPRRITKVDVDAVAVNRRRGGEIRVLLSPRTVGATSGFMGTVTLRPGEFVAEHYHPYSEEFLLLVRGRLTIRLDGRELVELAAGEALMIPPHVRHRVTNAGDEPAYAVFHLGPLAPSPELGHVDTEPVPAPDAAQPEVGGHR